jgi:hypothetical protein
VLFYLFGNVILFDFLIIVINIFLGSFFIVRVLDKKIGESLEFIIVNQAILFVVALNLGLMFGMGNILYFFMLEFMQTSSIEIILLYFFPIIGFFIGILLMSSNLRKKKWGDWGVIVIIINLLWLGIDIPMTILLLYFPLENLFFNFFLIGLINTIIGTATFKTVFFKGIKDSLGVASYIQSSIIGIFLLISTVIVFFPVLDNFEDLGASVLTLYIPL